MKQAAAQDKRKATIPPSSSLFPALHPLLIPSSSFLSLMYFLAHFASHASNMHLSHNHPYRHNTYTPEHTLKHIHKGL